MNRKIGVRAKKLLLSLAGGLMITAIAWLPLSSAEFVLTPGMYFASLFWPEGIHSGDGIGSYSEIVLFFSAIWLGTLLTWTALVYALLAMLQKRVAA